MLSSVRDKTAEKWTVATEHKIGSQKQGAPLREESRGQILVRLTSRLRFPENGEYVAFSS